MESHVVGNIEAFEPRLWDELVGAEPFSKHRFIRCLERAKIPDAQMRHVMFYEGGRPVACTSIFTHPFTFELIAPYRLRRTVGAVREQLRRLMPAKLLGEFLKTRILLCGLPISLGRSHLHFADNESLETHQAAWNALNCLMIEEAARENIHLVGAKEFDRRGVAGALEDWAKKSHYIQGHSLDTVTVKIDWESFDDYIDALRTHYRRQALADLRQSEKNNVVWQRRKASEIDPQVLYQLYFNVFMRADHRLERMTPEFFSEVSRQFKKNSEVILGIFRNQAIAMALLFHDGEQTTFMYAGLDYRRVIPFGIYRNLLLQIVRAAIERGSRSLEMGQTSYQIKERLGGQRRPLVVYLKDLNFAYHQMLKTMAPILFPEVKYVPRTVFKKYRSPRRQNVARPSRLHPLSAWAVSR